LRFGFETSEQARYWNAVTDGDRVTRLAGVQWADRADDGRLLVATRDGRLQIRGTPDDVRWEADLRRLVPDPTPAPPDARRW
jgi:hypothetical protein